MRRNYKRKEVILKEGNIYERMEGMYVCMCNKSYMSCNKHNALYVCVLLMADSSCHQYITESRANS